MANSKQKIIVHPKDKNEPLEKEATFSAPIEKNKEIVDENSNSNIFYNHSVMKISDKFPGRFSMNNLGTLVCENPVTKQDIQELKDYINENRSVLETAGLWRDPSVISFTTGKNDSSTPSIQVLDTELAAALASWKITQIESRSNYLQLVPNENMNSPLNIFSDLEHLRMYNGFQFAGNPETQIDMLKKSKPLYISMGTSKGNVCEMQDEILAGAEVLSVFISGGEKARIGKNSLAQNRIDDTSKLALEQSMNNVSKKPDYFLHRDIVVDNFKELVKGIDKNNNELLEKLSSSEEDISSFIRDQLVKSIFTEEETSLKDLNSLSDEELIDLIKAKLKTPLINRNVLESLKANEQLKKELKIGKDNADLKKFFKIVEEHSTLSVKDQTKSITVLFNNVPLRWIDQYPEIKELFNPVRYHTLQAFEELADTICDEYSLDKDGNKKHLHYRALDTNETVRQISEKNSLNSLVQQYKNIEDLTNSLLSFKGKKLKHDSITVNNTVMSISDTLYNSLAKTKIQYLEKLTDALTSDRKRSMEFLSSEDDNNASQKIGDVISFNAGMAFDTGAIAGRDVVFCGKSDDKLFMDIKLASELLEETAHVNSRVIYEYSRLNENRKDKSERINYSTEREFAAIKSIYDKLNLDDAGSLKAQREDLNRRVKRLSRIADEMKSNLQKVTVYSLAKNISLSDLYTMLQKAEQLALNIKGNLEDEELNKKLMEEISNSLSSEYDKDIANALLYYAWSYKKLKSEQKGLHTSAETLRKRLGDVLCPTEPKVDDNGEKILEKDKDGVEISGKYVQTPIYNNDQTYEFCSRLFSGNPFNGVESIIDNNGLDTGKVIPTSFQAKWLSFNKLDEDNAHKTLHLPIGTELGTCATQGTGIKAIEQRRVSHYTAEFDKTKIFYSSLQDSITQSFADLRQELISVGIRVPDNSFKHDDFKKAFEEFLNDNSLSPDAKTRIDSLRSICLQLCSEYLKASKWLSENPDKYLYMFNQSLRGTTLNQKIERLEKVLSDPDKTFTAEEKLSCENTLKELKEEKTKLLEELKVNGKMDTLCNNIVSEEVENVDLDYKQTKDQATTFPYAFNVNQSDGSCHIVDPSEGASKSEVLRGRVAEGMETLQTFGQKVLQYKHVSWGESIIYSGVVLSSIAATWAKKGVSCIHKKKIESDVKLATAYRIVAPLINSEEESSKDEIVFDKEGSWGQVLKFKSEEAERAWAAKGISLKLKNGHSIINVDLALATGGKEHGTIDIFGDTFRYIRKRNALPRVCAKEEKNREILDAIDLARKDRISRLVEKAQKRKDKATRSY